MCVPRGGCAQDYVAAIEQLVEQHTAAATEARFDAATRCQAWTQSASTSLAPHQRSDSSDTEQDTKETATVASQTVQKMVEWSAQLRNVAATSAQSTETAAKELDTVLQQLSSVFTMAATSQAVMSQADLDASCLKLQQAMEREASPLVP